MLQQVEKITAKAMQHAEGLFLDPKAEGYNADALVPLAEASTKTRFAIEVYKQVQANSREDTRAATALGVVALQAQMSRADWEAKAKKVDEDAEKARAIDVEATPADEEGEAF
ncbi:MAG: hypothetical protein ACO23N_07805 [Opitutales bacterium]